MKLKFIATVLGILFASTGFVHASEGHNHDEHKGSMTDEVKSELPNVGNKICPVSGQEIGGDMGEGVEVEYEGKLYNLCCAMCAKDFKKDPDKYIKIINKELENSENEDHVESKEGHKEEHDHSSHGQ